MAKIGLIILLAMSVMTLSYAAMNPTGDDDMAGARSAWTKHADVKGTSEKVDRGLRRLLFGWNEIPKSIVQTTKETKNPIWGLTGGTLIGLSKAFPRTVSGGADLATVGVMSDPSKPPVSPDRMQGGSPSPKTK